MDEDETEMLTTGDQPWQQPMRSLQKSERRELTQPRYELRPAGSETVVKLLTTVLALCAPAGFSEGDRKTWLTAAAMTLQDVPADLLERGVAEARRKADHPSKVVSIIFAEIKDAWDARKRNRFSVDCSGAIPPPPPEDFVPCTPEQAREIMEEFGLRRNPLDRAA